MKKIYILFSSLSVLLLLFLTGCTSQAEIDQLKQQNLLLQEQMDQAKKDKEAAAQALQDKANFENNLKCQERGDALKQQYNNVYSAYYNEYENTCYVKFYDRKNDNTISEGPMDTFGPTILETPLINGSYTIKQGVNFRTSPGTNGTIIQKIDPTNIVTILSYEYVNDELWYYIDMYGVTGYISSVAFK